ncbi:STAS domain-containing protein [Azospirillum canadense]|uniref:STAS domain-containing protein n=1 Tax=Azospirillum canadense TaxID=403962 RepID=UPI002226225C|nr:STAS domain-containing protein [Azospirillum canadense]MCW2237689.1 anti-anti-sigma factor [Azospirillum canadense]
MEYAYTEVDGQEGILLSGRFTYDDSPKFHALLADWDVAARPDVHLDLRYLTFLDSTAIGMLFILANRCRDAKGQVVVHNAQPYLVQTLRRVALDQYVTFC